MTRLVLVEAKGACDRVDERQRAAVHDRYLRTADVDQHVVHVRPAQRREQVLDGRHACVAAAEQRRAPRLDDVVRVGRKRNRAAVQAKAQAAACDLRADANPARSSGVKAHALELQHVSQRVLMHYFCSKALTRSYN